MLGSVCGQRRPWKHVWIVDGSPLTRTRVPRHPEGRRQQAPPQRPLSWIASWARRVAPHLGLAGLHRRGDGQAAELYLSELRDRVGFADHILMRDNYGDAPAYRLVFCTGSPHGPEQVSHLAHRYEVELKERSRPGQTDFFSEQEDRQH